MKLFITGASGFIGKHLVQRLVKNGHTIVVNERKLIENLPDNVKTFSINEGDIKTTIEYLQNQKFDGIIHLASLYITTHKSEDVVNLINSNVRFSTFVLEAAVQARIPWFINTGTFWQHFENKEYSPVNLYAATKQAFESIAQFYIETNQIKFVSLHLSDTYGPNDTRPKVFNLWEKIAKTGETLEMSPGEQVIDISHVDDIVSAYCTLVNHLQNNHPNIENGEIFAVKAEKRYNLIELAIIFENTFGKKLNINWGGRCYRGREVMVPWENCNVVPNWFAEVNIVDGINDLLKTNNNNIEPTPKRLNSQNVEN